MHMRTTLNINDDVLHEAARLTGIKEKTALGHAWVKIVDSQRVCPSSGTAGRDPKIPSVHSPQKDLTMVLVDTSVWVSHFRHKNDHLENFFPRNLSIAIPLSSVNWLAAICIDRE